MIVAEDVGFCFGVNRALEIALSEISKNERVYTLGELVHNKTVIQSLKQKGVEVIEKEIPEDAKDSVLIIRAHGVPEEEIKKAKETFKKVVDTTCPIVLNLFKTAQQMYQSGYRVFIFGKKDHPEMNALVSYAPTALITTEPVVLEAKSCILSQTTMSVEEFNTFVLSSIQMSVYKELRVINTICDVTARRERETKKISQESDLVIVLGGKNSSNTSKLAKIASKITRVVHIEDPSEVEKTDLSGINTIGIVTGTSTPKEDLEILIGKILHRREKK
ncbi:4-hydroxy-3-methylbut-2-enyl diphosphate reductase [Pseudothermotoga sp. U03pept]|uniref:4-hydroxy-3-methylbut-2-enyl diphosphate reductase n=1 Tax=Pseudothermotoga sp. U03pept TaxID=3447012 RepID=UPI003EFC8A92